MVRPVETLVPPSDSRIRAVAVSSRASLRQLMFLVDSWAGLVHYCFLLTSGIRRKMLLLLLRLSSQRGDGSKANPFARAAFFFFLWVEF